MKLLAAAFAFVVAIHAMGQPGYVTDADVLYRDPEGATPDILERCRLDVYYPEDADNFTTVVWFHAGGLRVGDKYVPGELRGKGFAVVAATYRLSPTVAAPTYIEDAAAALAWTLKNIESYGGSRDKIIVAGASAGGYLALMLGLDKRWLDEYGIDANELLGIAAIGGQAITHVAVRAEQGIERTRPTINDLAPLYHVRADAPPLMLATGDRELELLGRYEENTLLERYMILTGHTETELHELDGFDHPGLEKPAHGLLLKFIERLSSP